MDNIHGIQKNRNQLRLPKLISDGMVLQREADVRIWGWAVPEETVTVIFADQVHHTKADTAGSWEVFLHGLQSGGPFCMEVKAASTAIIIKDILVGEVWVCSGQSNMELPMERVKDQYPHEMNTCDNPQIRQFDVSLRYDFNEPKSDLDEGCWEAANKRTIPDFSAVGYFFAKALYEKYQVPVGIIKAAVGGSPVEAWISERALEKYPEVLKAVLPFKNENYVSEVINRDEMVTNDWYASLNKNDSGLPENGLPWYSENIDTTGWSNMNLPVDFGEEGLKNFNGVLWFRKEFEIPAEMLNMPARLWLGGIVDSDKTYVNGEFVGEVTYQYPPRKYDIPSGLLRRGTNIIAVRVICNNGQGRFIEDKPYKLTAGECSIDLKGEWKYRIGAVCRPLPESTFIQWQPIGLYNGMLAPLVKYAVKGILWYQGESNTSKPKEYSGLFKTLIEEWRERWNQNKLPFLFVQLPNYGPAGEQPSESQWAELREEQRKSLSIPDTGMAVAIDVGEWNDLHPLRKKEIGKRLALAAQKVAYNEDIIHSGPVYKGMKVSGNKIILEFSEAGGRLKIKDGTGLLHFAIAGSDNIFVWADAVIQQDRIIVWKDNIKEPKAVRYAWADNPEKANLINAAGLPASPFSTGS